MLPFLIRVGRVVTIVSAVATIIGAVVTGWLYGMGADLYQYGFRDPFAITPNRLGLAVVGGVLGVLVAGSVFGAIAALFEVHRHLRNMDPSSLSKVPDPVERAPLARRNEPKLT